MTAQPLIVWIVQTIYEDGHTVTEDVWASLDGAKAGHPGDWQPHDEALWRQAGCGYEILVSPREVNP